MAVLRFCFLNGLVKELENSRLSRSEIGGGPPVFTPAPRNESIKSRKCRRALTLV